EPYDPIASLQPFVEIHPETYWKSFCDATQRAINKFGQPDLITAVCIATQGETLVPVDHSGQPTRNAIVWLDNRAADEAQAIDDALGASQVFRRTGQPRVVP